ncbi:MAG: hypothetical protein Q8861_16525 [Bacteroidota bacterium]|nr:hypothetical protein [Bacteroidota bacterium]
MTTLKNALIATSVTVLSIGIGPLTKAQQIFDVKKVVSYMTLVEKAHKAFAPSRTFNELKTQK